MDLNQAAPNWKWLGAFFRRARGTVRGLGALTLQTVECPHNLILHRSFLCTEFLPYLWFLIRGFNPLGIVWYCSIHC